MISNLNTDGSAVSMAHVQQIATTAASPARPASVRDVAVAITRFDAHTWAASSSDPAKAPYKVVHMDSGHLRCSCEGNATWGRECRHIKAVRAAIVAANAPRYKVCEYCHIEPARQAGCYCSDRCADLGAAQSIYTGVDEADYVEDTAPAIGPVDDPIYRETASVPGVLAIHDAERARLAVAYAAPEGGSTDALHGAIAQGRARHDAERSRERHAKALVAPVGTFTTLCGPVYGLGE